MKSNLRNKQNPKRLKRLQHLFDNLARAFEEDANLPPNTLFQRTKPTRTNARLLKPPEAAKYLGLAVKTLANLRNSGKGPEYRRIGSRIFYRRVDIMRYRKNRRYQNTSQYLASNKKEAKK